MNAKVNKSSSSSDDHRGPGLVNIAAGALSHLGEQIMIGMINMIIINMLRKRRIVIIVITNDKSRIRMTW